MENKFKVVEIFSSISGESLHSGGIAAFIRLYGCNLRCKYSENGCDTPYGYEGDNYTEMTAKEILDTVWELAPNGLVVLTGGEPLIHPHIEELLNTLLVDGELLVEVETNGSVDVRGVCDTLSEDFDAGQLFFTVDYKCPSSGMTSKMLPVKQFVKMIQTINFSSDYRFETAVKFVVKTQEDLETASKITQLLLSEDVSYGDHIYISPVFGADMEKIIDFMQEDEYLCWCRFQLQIHKYIWDPDKRGV